MKRLMCLAAVVATIAVAGCTANSRARTFGGTATENLPKGQKLVNMTWKDDHLWILTRPMTDADVAQTYQFVESSSWGLMNGKVIVIEAK